MQLRGGRMANIEITQAEADVLIAMEKQRTDDQDWTFPGPGGRVAIPLVSLDKLTKATYQTRARQAIILLRLDLDGPPHRNPDDQWGCLSSLACVPGGLW
jgi:hypothetical protein